MNSQTRDLLNQLLHERTNADYLSNGSKDKLGMVELDSGAEYNQTQKVPDWGPERRPNQSWPKDTY